MNFSICAIFVKKHNNDEIVKIFNNFITNVIISSTQKIEFIIIVKKFDENCKLFKKLTLRYFRRRNFCD